MKIFNFEFALGPFEKKHWVFKFLRMMAIQNVQDETNLKCQPD